MGITRATWVRQLVSLGGNRVLRITAWLDEETAGRKGSFGLPRPELFADSGDRTKAIGGGGIRAEPRS